METRKERQDRLMRELASVVDVFLNGQERVRIKEQRIGFALLTFEFGKAEGGRVNYIGNGERDDVFVAMKELIARWEGRVPPTGQDRKQ